jgi:hypothetical protein
MTIGNYKWTTMEIFEKINKHNEHLEQHDEHWQPTTQWHW